MRLARSILASVILTGLPLAAAEVAAAPAPGAPAPTAPAAAAAPSAPSASAVVSNWMSWEGGVDLACMTKPGLTQPNLILHVARQVHTPVGSSSSGLVVWQPDLAQPPVVFGFVSENAKVGEYFGPHIFAGTPFEKAPGLPAKITVEVKAKSATSHVEVGGHVFTVTLTGLTPPHVVDRAAGAMPFRQQGIESAAATVSVTIDGKPVEVIVPPTDALHAPSAALAQTGIYLR